MGNTTQSLSIDTLALDISLLIAHVASPFWGMQEKYLEQMSSLVMQT